MHDLATMAVTHEYVGMAVMYAREHTQYAREHTQTYTCMVYVSMNALMPTHT